VNFVEFDRGSTHNPQLIHDVPISTAGDDQWFDELTNIQIVGNSTVSAGLTASYLWTQTAGPLIVLAGDDTDTVSF
jgi:hypothetical protein